MHRLHRGFALVCALLLTLGLVPVAPAPSLGDELDQATVDQDETYVLSDAAGVSSEDVSVTTEQAAEADATGGVDEADIAASKEMLGTEEGDEGDVDVIVVSDDGQTTSATPSGDKVALTSASDEEGQTEEGEAEATVVDLQGRVKLGSKTWQAQATGSSISLGTVKGSSVVSALRLRVATQGITGGITYAAVVHGKGWTSARSDWKSLGGNSSKRYLEAFRAKLTGEVATAYDLWYRVHVDGVGWFDWTSNWRKAGTQNFSRGIDRISLVLVDKGEQGPTSTGTVGTAYATKKSCSVSYAAWAKKSGWKKASAGKVAGKASKKASPVRIVRATLETPSDQFGSLKYAVRNTSGSWSSWSYSGQSAGRKSKPAQAVKIKLTGVARKLYDVWYRVCMEDGSWLGWAKNGQVTGAKGCKKGIVAYRVKLQLKGSKAPGTTSGRVVDKYFFGDAMTKRAQQYSSPTNWLILVDCTANKVGIFHGSKGKWDRVKYWTCSTGAPSTPTVKGVYSISSKGYSFGYGYTCYYWSSFRGPYYFHSVLYHAGSFSIMDGTLGRKVSHGCVRLAIGNAKWIWDNIPYRTTVVTY